MTNRPVETGQSQPWEHTNPRLESGLLAQYRENHNPTQIAIYANSSLEPRTGRRLFVAFALFCSVICALSVLQGNLWAPIFLVLNALLVGFALRAVLRRCQASDELRVRGAELIARQFRAGQERALVFPLAWVQLMVEHPRAECRIQLRAHGESMEIGSFLNREQRERLAEQLKTFLDLAKARAVSTL